MIYDKVVIEIHVWKVKWSKNKKEIFKLLCQKIFTLSGISKKCIIGDKY